MGLIFQRVSGWRYLNSVYASRPGFYFVRSVVVGDFAGHPTVLGHVVGIFRVRRMWLAV